MIENFFRSLRITLTNAFSYSPDHPYYIKSVESFNLELNAILAVLNPLKIEVTGTGLMVDAKNLAKTGLYDELARLLHQRKIKSIEIRSGAPTEEIIKFLFIISRPQKDIFKSGGVGALLAKAQLSHFSIKELDYSVFLNAAGLDCTDVWGYMLKDSLGQGGSGKLIELADNFGLVMKQVKESDLFNDAGLAEDISDFLVSLKAKDKSRFDKCTKAVFLWLLNNKKNIDQKKLTKLGSVFNGLSHEDLSSLFLDGLVQEDDFDTLSVQLFSKISKTDDPGQIANNVLKSASQSTDLQNNPKVIKKIQNILSAPQNDSLSDVYRNTLESLTKQINPVGKRVIDHPALRENYRYIVLSILLVEENKTNVQLAVKLLEKELKSVIEDKDFVFIKDLWGALIKRGSQDFDFCDNLNRQLSALIEDMILNQCLPQDQEHLIDNISESSHDVDLYLDKIFNVPKVNRQILKLFCKLFSSDLAAFYGRVDQKNKDMEFFNSLIEATSALNCLVSLSILEYIYARVNQLTKVEVLKSMGKLAKIDREFLIKELKTDSALLKKSILSVLATDKQGGDEALDLLLNISGFLGSKNKILLENMQLVYELKMFSAAKQISQLAQRRFFWNAQLRRKAINILKEWDAR